MSCIYICGDSFCVSDPEYGTCWVDYIDKCHSLTNLSQVTASNLLIAKQVEQAVVDCPDFIIVNFTSCTRSEKIHNGKIVPFSFHTANKTTTPFSKKDLLTIKEYFVNFFDLELSIYQNKITIEYTLQKLAKSGIPFVFDQGGFEHANFKSTTSRYFEQFDHYRSKINLWDYTVTRNYRPYYHIVDPGVHADVAEYYLDVIEKQL